MCSLGQLRNTRTARRTNQPGAKKTRGVGRVHGSRLARPEPTSEPDARRTTVLKSAGKHDSRRRAEKRTEQIRVTGFEPAALWTQTTRSTKLSYTLGWAMVGRELAGCRHTCTSPPRKRRNELVGFLRLRGGLVRGKTKAGPRGAGPAFNIRVCVPRHYCIGTSLSIRIRGLSVGASTLERSTTMTKRFATLGTRGWPGSTSQSSGL